MVIFLTKESSGYLLGDRRTADEGASSSDSVENANWDLFGKDQVTMIRIEDMCPEWCQKERGEGLDIDCSEVVYVLPSDVQGTHFMGEEIYLGDALKELKAEFGVYLLESSELETDGDSYEFQLQFPPKKEEPKPPTGRERLQRPLAKTTGKDGAPWCQRRPDANKTGNHLQSKSLIGSKDSNLSWQPEADPRTEAVVCSPCPPPGKVFKNRADLSVHLKWRHWRGLRKSYICSLCQKHCRNQLALDNHIRLHASRAAVFQCPLCSFQAPGTIRKRGVKGRFGIRVHLETEHAGIVPECEICKKRFRNLDSYLNDQVRHIGVTPFYCSECRIYEMTERGLLVHTRNHKRKAHGEGGQVEDEESNILPQLATD